MTVKSSPQQWQVCPATPTAKMHGPSAATAAHRCGAACSFTCWHFWNFLALLFYSSIFLRDLNGKFHNFHFFIKRKQLGAWIKAGESESKFWTNFPHISSGNLLQDWPLMSLLFSSWVPPERRLLSCQIVNEFGHMYLFHWGVRLRPPKVCWLVL